ncbi:right-handed parallel beta-helix repeat-containing protein [Allomesorhizobium alhagi]|uniref:right-handed parallel beta-helix repeat-containing protein n=1 Tax=Allomesorhizobium alhagi TaxID=475067 RepID=UPI0002DB506A|nr:right-handed parallel beta-helix repeat-containing protein [Mesorhizobium alhagi]
MLTSITHDGGTSGVVLDAVSGSFTVTGETTISNTSGPTIAISDTPAEIRFADITITAPGGDGLTFAGTNGPVVVGDLVITELGAGNAGLDFSGSRTNFTAQSVNITGTGAAGSTGIDLSGTLGGSSIVITAGGTIAGVETGIQLGVNGSGGATANANFVFGGGTIAGSTAALDARGLNPLAGTYAFGSTVFNGAQLFDPVNIIFVGSTATGAGDGSSINDLASIDTADADATSGVIFALVNDGSAINNADGFTLNDGQTLASFGNGRQFSLGGVPLNVTGDNVDHGVVQDDPTGLGAATLTNLGGGNTVILGDGTIIADIDISNGTGGTGIFGNDVDGVTLTRVDLVGAGALFTGTSTNVSASDFSATGSSGSGLRIESDGTFVFDGTTTLSSNQTDGLSILGAGNYTLGSLTASGNDGSGILIQGDGTLSVGAATLSGNQASGLLIDGAGDYSVNALTASGNLGDGVTLQGDGSFSFGGTATLSNNGGNGAAISGQGDYGFAVLDVQNNADGGLSVFSPDQGNLSIEGGTIAGNGSFGVNIAGVDLDVTLNSVSQNSAGLGIGGISLFEIGGDFMVTGAASIANVVSDGIQILGSQADISFGGSVTLDGVAGNAIVVEASGGSIDFGGAVEISNVGGSGILVDEFDGQMAFGGAVSIENATDQGIAFNQNSGQIGFDGPVEISDAGVNGIAIAGNAGEVIFGDVAISGPGGNGIEVSGLNGAIEFGNIDISGLAAGNTGLDLSGSTSAFTALSLDIAGTGAPGTTGIDLSGAQGGSVTIVNGGVIEDVDTGVQMGVNGAAGMMANTNFMFGGGSIEGATASLDMRGLISSSGTYAFGSTALIGPQLFDPTNVIFVGASATGAGDGSSVNDLIDAAGADAITDANAIFVLVNQGVDIATDADGFGLGDGQTLASFGNGATFNIGGAPINVTGDNVVSGAVQADPTGNGAARLVNNNAGGDTIVLGSGNLIADLIAGGNSTGAAISGLNVNNVRVSGVEIDSGFRGLDFDGVTGVVDIADIAVNGTAGHGISIVNSAATFNFDGTTQVTNAGGDGIALNGANGMITFASIEVDGAGGAGFSVVGSTDNVSVLEGSIGANLLTGGHGITVEDTGAGSHVSFLFVDVSAGGGDTLNLVNVSGLTFLAGSLAQSGAHAVVDIDDSNMITIDTTMTHAGTGAGIEIDGFVGVNLAGSLTRSAGAGGAGIIEVGQNSAFDGDVRFDNFTLEATGGGGILIDQIIGPGAVTFGSSSSITLTDTDFGFDIENISGHVSFDGDVSIQNPGGTGISVTGMTGGFSSVAFRGPVVVNSGAHTAINLANNAGGTISFDGALDVDTTTGVGFNASNGGTIAISGVGTQTINTQGATALQLFGVEIGSIDIDQVTVADTAAAGTDAAVSIVDTTGGTLTLGGISTENATTAGVFIANASGTYNFNGVTSVDGSQGVGIHIVDSAGVISFDEVDFDDIDMQGAFLVSNGAVAIHGGTIGRTGDDAILSNDTSLTVQDLTIGAGLGSGANGIRIVNWNQDRTVTIENVTVTSTAGIDGSAVGVAATGAGTLTLNLQGSTLRSTGTALDVTTSVGLAANAIRLNVDNNNFETAAARTVQIDGQNLSATENTVAVQSFADNILVGNGVGGGAFFSGVTFDADPDAPGFQQVLAGGLQIGQGSGQRVQGDGVSFLDTSGNIVFTSLAIINSAGTALEVSTAATDFTLGSAAGIIDAEGGPAIDLDSLNLAMTLTSVHSNNSVSNGLTFNDVDGTFTAGTTTIVNPGAAGIAISANQAAFNFGNVALNGIGANRIGLAVTGTNTGDITFGALSIALTGDNAVGVALNDAVMNGDLIATDFDLTSTSNTDTIGVNLVNTTGSGTIRLGDTVVNGGQSASITGVDDGVLFSSTTNVDFTFGDGESITDIGSLIDANRPVNTIDTLPLGGNYNFLDAILVGDTSFLQGPSYFVVDNFGTDGLGTFNDPGTIAQAEASGASVIVLVDRTLDNTSDLIDLLLQASGGGANSLDLADGQVLIALSAGEGINVASLGAVATGAPPSFQFAAINPSTITAPTTGIDSVLPVLTTSAGNTVNLAGQAGIQNVLIRNTGAGDGIFGAFGTGENLTIRNSTIGGATALNISAMAGATVFTFNDLTLEGTLRLDGTGGDLTVIGMGANTISAGGQALELAALGVGTGGLSFDLIASGGGAIGVSASDLDLADGNVAIASVALDGHTSSAIALQNIGGVGGSFTIGAGDIDVVGTGVLVNGANSAVINIATAGGLTIDGGVLGLDLQHSAGTVNIGTGSGFVAVGDTARPTAGLAFASSGIVNIGNAANASSIGAISHAISLASTGTLNLANLTARSTSASGIAAANFGGSASFDGLAVLGISGANNAIDIVQSGNSSTLDFTDLTIDGFAALATGDGISISASGAGSVELNLISGNSVTAPGFGLEAFQSAGATGTVVLGLEGTVWETTGAGTLAISVGSDTPGGTFVTAFGSNTVTGNGVGGGIVFEGVTFDADPDFGIGIQQVVASGANRIGTGAASRVSGVGLSLLDTSGSLDVGTLDIFNNSGAGDLALVVDTTTLATTFTLAAQGGVIDNANGGAVFVDTATLSGSFTSTSATFASGRGIDLQRVAGDFDFGAGALTNNGGGAAFNVGAAATDLSGGSADIFYGGNIVTGVAATGLAVSIAELDGGSVTLSGNLADSNAAAGGGILVQNLNNGAASVTFSGNSAIRTGTATAVTLSNNASGIISFAGGLDIDTTTGTGFLASGGGVINVGAAGSQIIETTGGTALNLNGVTLGSVNFDQIFVDDPFTVGSASAVVLDGTSGGTLTLGAFRAERSTSDSIAIANVVSGTYNFNGSTTVLSTVFGADAVSIANSAGTFLFTDLDASQLTGMAFNLDASSATITVSGGTIVKGSAGRAISVTGGDASTVVFDAAVTATNGTGLLFDDADGSYSFGGAIELDDTGSASGIGIDIINDSDGDFTFDDVQITNTAAATALGADILLGANAIAVDIYDSGNAITSFGDLDIVSAADIGVAARDGGIVNIGSAGDPSVINAGFGLVYYDTSGTVANAVVTAGTDVPLVGYSIEAAANSLFGFFPLGGQTGISVIAEQADTSFALSDSTVFGAAGLMNVNFADQQFALDRNTFSSDGGPGVYISGLFGPGSVFVTSFDSNTMDDGGDVNPDIDEAGFVFDTVTFDADLSSGVIDTVAGGATRIGSAGVRVNNIGLQLIDVEGALSFSDLDIATEGEIALDVFGAGATPADFALTILDGDIDAQNGQALWLENATLDATLSSVTSTNAFGCCFSTGDGILLTGLAGSFAVTGTTTITGAQESGIVIEDNAATIDFGTTTVTGAGVNGILVDSSAAPVDFGTTTIAMSGGPGKTGIDFAGTNTSVTFGTTTISGVDAGQVGIDFSDAETTATFGLSTISSTTGSATSTGIDLSGTLGNRTITFAQGSDIDNLGVGVQLGTAGRGAATANAAFTFGDGNSADGLESSITAAVGGYTVDTIGLDPTSGTYDFDDVLFTGDANLVVAPDSATFVSQSGGQITVGTFGLSQTINTISLADADALTAAGTIFAFVGPIDLAAAGFDLDAGQSITGFGNANTISFGTIQPTNVFGNLGATGGDVTGNETTITGTDTLFTLAGGNEIRHTTFDLSSGVVGSAVFAASTVAAGNDITIEGVTITGVGQGRVAFDLTNVASDTFIQNNNIAIAGTLLDVSGGSGDITGTRGMLPNGGPAGTLTAGRVIVDSRAAGSAVTFADQLALSSGADDAVLLTGNTGAAVSFAGGLDITTTTGRGFVATGGGTITIDAAGITEIDTNGGMALFLDAVTAAIEFDAVNSTNSATHGILLDTVAGTLTINGGLLSGANAAGLEIVDSSGTFTFTDVDVVNSDIADGRGVVIASSIAATVNFTDLDITTTGAGDDGFVVSSVGGTVNVTGTGNTINVVNAQAIDIDGGAGALANVMLDVTFDTVNANPNTDRSGIELDEISGIFTVVGGTINKSGTAGAAVDIGGLADSSGGDAVISIGAALNNTGTGRSVLIQELTGGSVTLSGDINDSGAGLSVSGINNGTAATITLSGASKIFSTGANRAIDLGDNINGTVNFTNGGLAITTTSGEGFFATAGGTINVSGVANTIATTAGAAIDLNGVSIGGSGFNFATVGVNGATTGVNLTSVTSAGGGIALGTVDLQNVTVRGIDINTALGAALSISDLDISLNDSAAIAFDLNGAALSAAVTAEDFDVTNAAAAGTSIGVDLRGTTGGQIVRLGDATVANPAFSSIASVNTGVFLNAATDAAFTFGDGESATNQQSTISANVGIDATSAPVAGTYNFQDVVFAASPGNGFGVGDIYFVAATATGDGSGRDASNRATLATAEAASGTEDILVLIDDGGAISAAGSNGNDTLVLDSSEQVRGFGNGTINLALTVPSTIQLASTSIAITDPTGSGAARLSTSAANNVITLGASGNIIDGFILDGDPAGAARGVIDNGAGATGTTISNMRIRNFDSFGIEITPSTDTTIDNVIFSGNASDVFLNAAGTTIINVTSTGATGTAFQLDNVSGTTTLTNISISGAVGGGISFGGVTGPAGTINATNVDVTNAGAALSVVGGNASFNFDAASSITQANNAAAISVSGGHTTGTFSFAGTIGANNGTGLQFDNADGTYNFTGTTTLNGGDAGIDIVNDSGGTFAFGASTTITNPTGTAFAVAGSNANVTYSGSITDNTGFAVDIDNHNAGAIIFQTGTITSTGTGLRVQNSNGGTVNFNNQSIQLSTGSAAAVTLAANTGGTVNFSTGAGLGLDIVTTTGAAFTATGGGAISVLGDGNSISTGAGAALNLSGVTVGGSVNFQSTSKGAGGTSAVILSGVTGSGTINLGSGTLVGGSGAAIRIGDGAGGADTGGTVGLVYSGTVTNTTVAGSTGRAVDIQDRAAGAQNITLSGNITHNVAGQTGIFLDDNAAGTITFSGSSKSVTSGTATAINLTDNSGAAINFTNGGLVINTTSFGIGFNATGAGPAATTGGTVTVQGAGNTIASTTGTALNVVNTTIGASNLTFQSISSNGGGSAGINLSNTGASGGLTITGIGTTAGSGGTINNKTVNGITLNNTRNVSLSNMIIDNNDGSGVGGAEVTNFSIIGSTVSNNADTATGEEAGLRFTGLYGNSAITNTTFSGSSEDHVRITNSSGVLTNLAVSGSTFNANSAATGGHALALLGTGTAQMTANVTNSTFSNIRSSGTLINVTNTAVGTLNVSGSTFTDIGAAVTLQSDASADLNFDINGNTTVRAISNAIQLVAGSTGTNASNIVGRIRNNTVGNGTVDSGSRDMFGIAVDLRGDQDAVIAIDNNNVRNTDFEGIWVSSADFGVNAAQHATLDLHLRDNTVGAPDDNSGFPVGFIRGTLIDVRHTTEVILDISGNSSQGIGGGEGFRVRQRDTSVLRVERLTDGDGTPSEIISDIAFLQAFIAAQNDLGSTVNVTATIGFTEAPDGVAREP